jgi:putative peptidoglycan lipid II flippase
MSGLRNVASVFYAFKDARTPMYASFASIAVNIVLNLTLMRPMGFLAFPLSMTIASVVNIAILFFLVPRKVGKTDFAPLARYAAVLAAAAAVAGLAGWLIDRHLFAPLGPSLWLRLASVIVSGSTALGLFYALCVFLRIGEAKHYLKRFMTR